MSGMWSDVAAVEVDQINHQQFMHLIGLLRQRLITLANGSQEEYTLRNLFRKFDVDNSGALTL